MPTEIDGAVRKAKQFNKVLTMVYSPTESEDGQKWVAKFQGHSAQSGSTILEALTKAVEALVN